MIVIFTFVFFTVSFLINLYLIPAFFRRGQMVAGFFYTVTVDNSYSRTLYMHTHTP